MLMEFAIIFCMQIPQLIIIWVMRSVLIVSREIDQDSLWQVRHVRIIKVGKGSEAVNHPSAHMIVRLRVLVEMLDGPRRDKRLIEMACKKACIAVAPHKAVQGILSESRNAVVMGEDVHRNGGFGDGL